jgi:hypothetical protein
VAAKQIEITGVLVSEFRPPKVENFVLGSIHPIVDGELRRSEIVKIVGNAEPNELTLHLAYRWYGHFDEHPQYGRQFKFSTFTPAKPHGQEGVTRYLQQCDGVGAATAIQIWQAFGPDAVRICREHPDIVAGKISRLKPEVCEAMAAKLKEFAELEDTSIELIDLLHGRGFPKAVAREAVKKWGNKAPRIIQLDPFKLMAFRGCGFLRCDSMWTDLGLPPAKLKRQVCCAWYSLASDTEGHTWHPDHKAGEYLKGKISGVQIDFEKTLAIAIRAKAILVKWFCEKCQNTGVSQVPDLFTGESLVDVPCKHCGGDPKLGRRWVAEHTKGNAEEAIARHIALAERETDPAFLSAFDETVEKIVTIPTHTRCTRCHRKLTAPEVAILHDQPYGPDCITKVPGGEFADRATLEDWLADKAEVTEKRTSIRVGVDLVKFLNLWPDPADLDGATDHQRDQYAACSAGRIGILAGSPGTGKTWLAAAIVKAITKKFGPLDVAIAAPTGKAAVRCTESMNAYGLRLKACTIHSLLGVESADEGAWSFKHNERNPLPYKFIIIDESSMIDTNLMRSLLAARARGTHLLFVGDPNQLPPVGHGAPLRDLIAARLPYGELREIKRNAGTIVKACAAIRDGQRFPTDNKLELEPICPDCHGTGAFGADVPPAGGEHPIKCDQCDGTGKLPPRNLVLVNAHKSKAFAAIEQQVCELRDAGVDPIWNVQVVVAVNKRSPLSRTALNKRLQEVLNPGGKPAPGSPFRVGDKVICLKNSCFKNADPYAVDMPQVAVANGEFGKVLSVEERKTTVEFFSPSRKVIINRFSGKAAAGDGKDDEKEDATGTGCDLDLGYAATCHKMQGSDCDYVIIGLDEYPGATGSHGICKREWLFTGISRGKLATFLVGQRSTAQTQVSETALDKRKTFLRESIDWHRRELSRTFGKTQQEALCYQDGT